MNKLFNIGIEISLNNPQDFLKIKETLTRIGIASKKENTLYQSCHILHKKDRESGQSRYAIVHFKELFILDHRTSTLTDDDIARRNLICKLLSDWGLINLLDEILPTQIAALNKIKIILFKDKENWKLVSKYNIGKKLNNKFNKNVD